MKTPKMSHYLATLLAKPRIAEFLGVAPATAEMWALAGRFRSFRIDGRLYASRRDLSRFKKQLEQERHPSRADGATA